MGKPNRRNTPKPWQPDARQLEIYHRATCGSEGQRAIASAFHVSQQYVSQTVRKIDQWLAPQWMESIREMKANHTERLLHIFREAMAAWERSKLDAVAVTTKTGNKPGEQGGPYDETATQTRGQSGNPTFLSEARGALAEIRKIWGADAPLKVEHSGEVRVAGRDATEARNELAQRLSDQRAKLMTPSEN